MRRTSNLNWTFNVHRMSSAIFAINFDELSVQEINFAQPHIHHIGSFQNSVNAVGQILFCSDESILDGLNGNELLTHNLSCS